jgi:copper resistance protein B
MRAMLSALAGLALFSSAALAQSSTDAAPFGPPVMDGHIFSHLLLDALEGRFGAESSLRWDAEAWAGGDTNRLWLKSEGEWSPDGRLEGGRHELLYSRPLSRYFDLQAGVRLDADSGPGRTWLALGVEGLAPLFFHVSATAYAGDRGRYAARLKGDYDLLLTQRLILQPGIEATFQARPDPARGTGAGLAGFDAGLRLRYEIDRKFAPYLAVTYESGTTGQAVIHAPRDEMRVAVGVRAWW